MDQYIQTALPFWHFFRRLEKELSYEPWIEKYKLFLQGITELGLLSERQDFIPGGTEQAFVQFCKFLYLQDVRDEKRFEEILKEAIQVEKKEWAEWIREVEPLDIEEDPEKNPEKDSGSNNFPSSQGNSKEETPTDSNEEPETETPQSIYLQYRPAFSYEQGQGISVNPVAPRFLDSDEYFPLTRREMVKSWQYLRIKKKSGFDNQLDMAKIVDQVAVQGIFTSPVYRPKLVNRNDALVIFADTRGSMTPFEALSDRLIETAKGQTEHPNAPVFYFQNFPGGYVFKARNLSEPIPLAEALRSSNAKVTYAIVISDAGAARGVSDEEVIANRAKMTQQFLKILQQHTSKIIWVNPMPRHRWANTAAERIAFPEKFTAPAPDVMLSVLDEKSFHFQSALHVLRLASVRTVNP